MQKLYEERKINPFGGCLLLLIQIPLIYSMFFAIAQPVKFMYPEIRTAEVDQAIEKYAQQGTYKEMYYMVNERQDIINTEFFGLDLGKIPQQNLNDWTVYIIPVLYIISTFISMKITTNMQNKNNKKDDVIDITENSENKENERNEMEDAMAQSNKMMSWMMPIMSVSISLVAPLGLALYWLVNNVLMIMTVFIHLTIRTNC